MFLYVVLAFLIAQSDALYPSNSDVVELTSNNFNKLVINSDDVWVVEFFAPWCGHCQNLVPEYEKAARALKNVVKVGAIDVDNYKEIGSRFGIKGFPTIKIFGSNKNKPEDFNGQRTAAGIVKSALSAVKDNVYQKLGVKSSEGSSDSGDNKDVIELTDGNFDKLVIQSEEMWLVEFYAPWCGHCKNLAPHWAKAATELKGKVKVGALDATVHTKMASKYGVQGYPTIKYFPPGKKTPESAIDYNGERTSSAIVAWALEELAENVPAPELIQVVNEASFQEACLQKPLCVISVLPHILDCQSACRNEYLDMLQKMAEKFKKKLWGWLWAEAGAQPELEKAMDIGGFGYPAMAVINHKKMKYSILRGAFSADGINEFLRDLSYGRGNTAPVQGDKMPQILETEPWDGKDGELPAEEDIDLSDVILDEEGESEKDEL